MRFISSALINLLISAAVGFGTYTAGAVIWSAADPFGAGRSLLFTIPVGIACSTLLAIIAALVMVNRDLLQRVRPVRRRATKPVVSIPPRPRAAKPRPARSHTMDDLEAALVS